ncbi:hypothetical protein C8Q78DRAFT_1059853 [Trametes maxima]|nr:hypothetical protein C8Q78DRAFT_1059853 [Trametes maxima]
MTTLRPGCLSVLLIKLISTRELKRLVSALHVNADKTTTTYLRTYATLLGSLLAFSLNPSDDSDALSSLVQLVKGRTRADGRSALGGSPNMLIGFWEATVVSRQSIIPRTM